MTHQKNSISSRLSGFYQKTISQRRQWLQAQGLLETGAPEPHTLSVETADALVENVIGTYQLPWAIATNFRVNHTDYLIPLCIEEPSVVAAASRAALLVRERGGFAAQVDASVMIGQVLVTHVPHTAEACQTILQHKEELLTCANAAKPSLVQRGGGAQGIEARVLSPSATQQAGSLVVHLLVDCVDAMGANLVNTMAEAIGPRVAAYAQGQLRGCILSNLTPTRKVTVTCEVPCAALATTSQTGAASRDGIVALGHWAEQDPYRAATHNKGILNGVDAVALATGNDWRGIEAGAHAFAAQGGSYQPLSRWWVGSEGDLCGQLIMPLAVGTQGGTLAVHPGARASLRLLQVRHARELAAVMGAVGLATNLAALRALAGPGIQQAHLPLHARSTQLHTR